MTSQQGGRAWLFGDDVDTDILAPGIYMKGPIEEMAAHCLEAIDPDFAKQVKAGDVVVAGRNFGMGSSREQAAQVLKQLGISAVVARSFGGIFYRNALNLGLVAVVSGAVDHVKAGQHLAVDAEAGRVDNRTNGETYVCDPIPRHLMAMIADGGLVPHLEKNLAEQEKKGSSR